MEDIGPIDQDDLIAVTSELVSAYVSNNHVRVAELPDLIATTHAALTGLGTSKAPAEPAPERMTPAQVRKSITHDGIISFIDGKSYKTLKRHLTSHGLTPERYRERYGLPHDYPVTAAGYSETRSNLARSLGLGQGRKAAAEPATEAAPAKPKRAGRPKKATDNDA